eukprot:TRINITY_DN2303_c0_g1_i1.p1 TRINITY_DN2303_c0_g1~~TRINITY_DN2303_c0_g1_i1.p1  ORF type:complete len:239 (-),score=66.03 TRINITY_DN2303_c0_g1_i1:44-760(-)
MAMEVLRRTVELDREQFELRGLSNFKAEIKEATKTLRYVLTSLMDSPKNKIRIVTLDTLWKTLLFLLEMAASGQDLATLKELSEQVHTSNLELTNAREEIRALNARMDRLSRKSQEFLIQYNAETGFLRKEAESLKCVAEAKSGQVEQLLNPYRFLYVHYFLKRFAHQLPKNKAHELESLANIFQALSEKENYQDEVDDSIGGGYFVENYRLPPSLMQVLRKLPVSYTHLTLPTICSV